MTAAAWWALLGVGIIRFDYRQSGRAGEQESRRAGERESGRAGAKERNNKMSELKDRIKEIRVRDHITQNDFAKRINATPGFISNVENGRSGLSDEKIQAIVLSFHVSEEWLRHGDGAMTPFGQDQSQGNKEEVGIRIKRIRKQKELSQDEFAKKIGVHKN